MSVLSGVTYRGGATHPVGAYAIHNRKIANRPVSFRLGVKNIVDLENLGEDYRKTDVIGRNPDGSTINLYRYLDVFAAEFSVTLDF